MNTLFKKPNNMRWVDLAIWIDDNFYKKDCDMSTAYEYMYLLALMLATKRRYFTSQEDYEEFASILAYDTFKRMSNPDKSKVKSVLNYMKSIISFRRIAYNSQRRQKIIDPQFDVEWDPVAYTEIKKDAYEASNRDILFEGVNDVLKSVPKIIKQNIPKVFKSNLLEYENIYKSCLLSMLTRVTLPDSYNNKLMNKLDDYPNFDEVKFYKKYLDDEIILWHLSDRFSNVVRVVLNKTYNQITDNIKELSNDIKVSDVDFANIMSSGFTVGGSNETDY